MALELGNSPLEDPLSDCSLLYLLPKTLGSAPSHALLAASEAEELGSIENLFESMVMEGSTQLLQQAQRITKNHTNIDTLYPEDEPVAENFKDRHSERRPALGLKRAKFSLKPAPSDSLQNIDFSSIIDDIDDPEEYFLAFEQLEIAEKELKKLRGKVSTDLGLHHQGTTTRERRPGLRGKTASYKHHISANFDTADTLVELQEKLVDRRIASSTYSSVNVEPSNLFHSEPVDEPGISQAKDANIELQAAVENEGSIAEKENKVDNLLENLLSSFNNFDEEEGKTYLRDSLQIRSIDAGKMHLPALPNTQLSQHSTFNRKAMCRELKVTQNSRPLTKSPLATLSTLRKRLSLIGPLEDLNFLSPSDDAPSSGDPSFSKSAYSESLSPVKVGNDDNSGIAFNDDSSPVVENGTALGFVDDISPLVRADRSTGKKIVSKENLTKNRYTLLEKNTNPDKGNLADEVHPKHLADEFDGSLQEVNDRQLDPVITDEPDAGIEGCSNHSGIQDNLGFPTQLLVENTDGDSNAPGKDKDASGISFGGLQEGDNMQQDVSITKQPNTGVELLASNCADQITTESIISPHNRNMGENCSNSAINSKTGISGLDETAQSKVNAKVQEKVFDVGTSKDNSSPPEAPILTDRQLENLRSLAEENNEEHQMESGAPSNEGRKQSARTSTSNKRKSLSGRKSLSDNSSPREAPILTDRQLENMRSLAEENNEEHQIEPGAPSNEGRKQSTRTRTSNKRKSLSGRKSLSDNSCPPEAPILTDRQLENLRSLAEENNEEHQMESGAPSNEGRKQSARTRTSNKRKFLSGRKSLSDNSSPPEAPILTDRQMENVCSLADINEEHQMASGAPSNEGRKQSARTRMSNKRNSLSGRKSLSGAGMIWEDGRRKSSRRRFRPLQHWRGERLLYGRIHNSLATVIGMKYRSPGKSGLKVESYVSEEYADLVAQVARC